jgi:LPXTG-site transpeptidase (sortase) family protein
VQKVRPLTYLGGALVLGDAAFLAYYGSMQRAAERAQLHAQEWLNRSILARRPGPPVSRPVYPRVSHGDVLGRLTIPRLNLSVMVFEGDDAAILKQGAGHIPGTTLPDEIGNFGIAAHRDTYFRPLRLISPNDLIEFTTPKGVSRYTVTDTGVVLPFDIQVLAKAPYRNMTLVTCYPFYYLGSAPKRWIVHAKQI